MFKILTCFSVLKLSLSLKYGNKINNFNKPGFNKDILPISCDNAISVCYEWKMSQPTFDHNDKNIFNFIDYININKPLVYQWVPNDENNVKALIPVKLKDNKINVIGILPDPNTYFFSEELVKAHLEELKTNKEYKDFEISYEYFRNYD